jgi:hypothetical protein
MCAGFGKLPRGYDVMIESSFANSRICQNHLSAFAATANKKPANQMTVNPR